MGIYDLLDSVVDNQAGQGEGGEPLIPGVMIGVVTENNNADFPGMVKVELLVRQEKKNITDWMKVVSLYGGSQWGLYVMPEVGDQVLVAFEQGSIHKPFVIGCVYKSDSQAMKKSFQKDNFIKKFKTRGGHEVTFHDESDKTYIEIKTAQETSIRLDDDQQALTLTDKNKKNFVKIDIANSKITVESGNKLLLNSNSSKIHIEGDANQITAKSGAIKLESTASLKLKAQSLDIEASMLNIKASGVLNLNSDGVANLKGSIVKIN